MWKTLLFAGMIPAMLAVFVFLPGCGDGNLNALKKQQELSAVPEEARQVVQTALAHIAKNDMSALFRMMATRDSMKFEANYTAGIFAEKDFSPATILRATRQEKGTTGNLSVVVRSEPRKQEYQFTLLPNQTGELQIQSITICR